MGDPMSVGVADSSYGREGGYPSAGDNPGNNLEHQLSMSEAYLPCKVCGDKSSGFHYGVMACEGCKGFFRRSIQKKIEYRCHFSGNCPIERINRNRCQHCRFKKCLAVGMSRDSVRIGRYSKRMKQNNLDEIRRLSVRQETIEEREVRERYEMEIYNLTQNVVKAHQLTCCYTSDKAAELLQKKNEFIKSLPIGEDPPIPIESFHFDNVKNSNEREKVIMWTIICDTLTPGIKRVVEFSKCLPGFMDLCQEDQMVLLKQGFFEVWIVHVSSVMCDEDGTLTLNQGQVFTKNHLMKLGTGDLWKAVFEFCASFNQMTLNDTEIALFTAIIICTPDRPGITSSGEIEKLQEKYTECLKKELAKRCLKDQHLFPKLLMKMTNLRSIAALQNEKMLSFKLDWPNFQIPPLLAELNDLSGVARNQSSSGNGEVVDIMTKLPILVKKGITPLGQGITPTNITNNLLSKKPKEKDRENIKET